MAATAALDIATLGVPENRNLTNIARGWDSALRHSEAKLADIFQWDADELEEARRKGIIMLETSCLFVHACIKPGQFKLPPEFWRILHLEYGIVVYPSAFTENIRLSDGDDNTFTSAYKRHIVMFGRGHNCRDDPPCPFAYLQEPPPQYEKLPSTSTQTISLSTTDVTDTYEKRNAFPPVLDQDDSTDLDYDPLDIEYSEGELIRCSQNEPQGSATYDDEAEVSSEEDDTSSWGVTEEDALDSQDGCAFCTECQETCDSDKQG